MDMRIALTAALVTLLLFGSYLWDAWNSRKSAPCLEYTQAQLVGGATIGLVRPCGDTLWRELWRRN